MASTIIHTRALDGGGVTPKYTGFHTSNPPQHLGTNILLGYFIKHKSTTFT